MALNAYVARVRQLLHDPNGQFYNTADIISYINTARRQVAMDGECIRVLPPSNPGQNQTVTSQEVYTFSSLAPLIQAQFPGVQKIVKVLSIAVSWGSMKPTLRQCTWSDMQAYLRSYSTGLQNYPTYWAQYGQGANGSAYLWPIPSGEYPMDWDCVCLPIDLLDDSTPDVIPEPWDDPVCYYATYLAYLNTQRAGDAETMRSTYKQMTQEARAQAEGPWVPDFYPSGI